MTTEIALTLTIIVAALALFATKKLRVDLVALSVLLTVGLLRLISPQEIFDGSANPAVITVWAVYVVSNGLFKTGVADAMGRVCWPRMHNRSKVRHIGRINHLGYSG